MKILLTGSTSYVGTKFVDMFGTQFDILGVSQHDPDYPVDLQDFKHLQHIFSQFNPDVIMHLAADVGRDVTKSNKIEKTNPAMLQNLIDLALPLNLPILFTSTEAVYGGKEEGNYVETDPYLPRSPYGSSKVISEQLLVGSGLPHLITRGHRHVGLSPRFHKPKWFPDTLNELSVGKAVHLDSKKIFNPVLINTVCEIYAHHVRNHLNEKTILNMGTVETMTYYDFFVDVAEAAGLDMALVNDDGEEPGWPNQGALNVEKLNRLGYPSPTYRDAVAIIAADIKSMG